MNVVYGLYLDIENNRNSIRYIYDVILSIMSIECYNSTKINKYIIYTNNAQEINNHFDNYLSNIRNKILVLQDTSFVDIINSVCGYTGAHRYLTRGIFYRLQALCSIKNMLYLDTDVICNGKIKLPKYNKARDIIKNKNDSSCIMYSYNGIDGEDLLYYVQCHKKHIGELAFPDECVIHDAFDYMERLYDFKVLHHFGNTDYYEHNMFNKALFDELYNYIRGTDNIEIGIFNSYFRSPRYSFVHKEVEEIEEDNNGAEKG